MNGQMLLSLAVFGLLTLAAIAFLRLDQAAVEYLDMAAERREKAQAFRSRGKLRRWLEGQLLRGRSLILRRQIPLLAYLTLTILCGFSGYCAGKIIFSSGIIAGAVGTVGLLAPLLYFSILDGRERHARLEQLASSMTILSNAYLATDDFLLTVQENLDLLEYPRPFRDFLAYMTVADSSMTRGLRRMAAQVNNPYFSQWADALLLAQEDRTLKYAAVAVVDSFHSTLQIQAESDAAMYAVWRDYFLVLILIFSVPLIFRMTLPEVYLLLTTSFVGQALFLLLLAAVLFSVLWAVKLNRPMPM